MRVLLYQPKTKRTVISILDVTDIKEYIEKLYDGDIDEIPLKRKNLYRIALASHHIYKVQTPACWRVDPDGTCAQLILGDVLFVRKGRKHEYVGLTDKDIVYITLRYRPYNFSVV